MKQDELDGDLEFIMVIRFGSKSSTSWKNNNNNFENGKEYAKIIESPYQNPILDRQVMRTKKIPTWHMLFLP